MLYDTSGGVLIALLWCLGALAVNPKPSCTEHGFFTWDSWRVWANPWERTGMLVSLPWTMEKSPSACRLPWKMLPHHQGDDFSSQLWAGASRLGARWQLLLFSLAIWQIPGPQVSRTQSSSGQLCRRSGCSCHQWSVQKSSVPFGALAPRSTAQLLEVLCSEMCLSRDPGCCLKLPCLLLNKYGWHLDFISSGFDNIFPRYWWNYWRTASLV